jgi:predicted cupin superfamily sugar epimerase
MNDASYWIETLRLQKHPEGGYYRQTYRDARQINDRACSTAIYFLLPAGEFSALHRLKSDEVWHFYAGHELTIHLIDPAGNYTTQTVGSGSFQAVVPAGHWFGATVALDYALVGCTVAPGFDFCDFELADRAALLRQYPQHRPLIERLTR